MKNRMNEIVKTDMALAPVALNNASATGSFLDLASARKAIFYLAGGALAAGKTTKLEVLQAKSTAGLDAKVFSEVAEENAEITLNANTNVLALEVDLAAAAVGDKVIVNGETFTMAAATDTSAGEFADAAGLAACIAAHCTGVETDVSGTTVEVASKNGESDITCSAENVGGVVAIATTRYLSWVEIQASDLDRKNGFSHVAPKVTTTGNGIVAVIAQRGETRLSPINIGLGKALW